MSNSAIFNAVITFGTIIIIFLLLILSPSIIKITKEIFQKTRYIAMGNSSKIRLVRQLDEAISSLSKNKVGAIITIVNKDKLDHLRTDGIKVDGKISASLILSIFNKNSPLHDGAIIIDNNIITYAGTYYKITSKSLSNRYGARHRAAMGISEQSDALTIVISEENGRVTFFKNGILTVVKPSGFQEKFIDFIE